MSGLDLGGAVNSAADWVCDAPIVGTVINNPVLTAILITALVAVVALAMYNDRLKAGGGKLAARALLYIFFFTTLVTFVHHCAVTRTAERAVAQRGVRDVFAGIQASQAIGGGAPVVPIDHVRGVRFGEAGGEAGERADNVAADAVTPGELVIEDVVVPTPTYN